MPTPPKRRRRAQEPPERKARPRWLAVAAAIAATVAFVVVVLPRLRPASVPEVDEATARVLTDAQTHFDAGRFDQAIAVAEAHLAGEPDAASLHYVAGAALAEQGEHRRAVPHFEAAIEHAPAHLDSSVRLAVSLIELGQIEPANQALRAALRREPGHARASLLLGRNLARAGAQEEAEPLLRRAAEGTAGGTGAAGVAVVADAWDELGLLYRERDDLPLAEDAFRRALAADPDHLEALFHLGQTLERAGRDEEGRRFLGRHAELEERNDRVDLLRRRALEEGAGVEDLVNLGRYLLLQRDVDGAVAAFRHAIERDPGHAPARVALGQALLEGGRARAAMQELAVAVERAPDSAEAHFFLGLARHLDRDYTGAQQALGRSRQLRPWNATEYLFFGNVLASSGALADAELAYRSSLEAGPEIPESRYKLGLTLQARDRATEARSELERFVELEPRDPRGALLLAVAQHRAGDVEGAATTFRSALARVEVALPDPAAFDSLIAELRGLPGASEALATLETLRHDHPIQPGATTVEREP